MHSGFIDTSRQQRGANGLNTEDIWKRALQEERAGRTRTAVAYVTANLLGLAQGEAPTLDVSTIQLLYQDHLALREVQAA